jgi:hypothetical protein
MFKRELHQLWLALAAGIFIQQFSRKGTKRMESKRFRELQNREETPLLIEQALLRSTA